MLVAWIASRAAGAAFYRWVEVPLGRVLMSFTRPARPRPSFARQAGMQSRAVAKLRAYR
jgi:hypothetical protein